MKCLIKKKQKKEFSDNKYNENDVDINNVLRNIIRTERINDYLI